MPLAETKEKMMSKVTKWAVETAAVIMRFAARRTKDE